MVGFFDLFSSTPSPAKFAAIVIKAIAAQGRAEAFDYDPGQFRLVSTTDQGRVLNLHNAYRDYCAADKKDRKALLDKYFSGTFNADMPSSFAEARGKILPILRSRALVEYLRLSRGGASDPQPLVPAAMPFSADAVLMLAVDGEHSMMTLTRAHLDEWQVSFEQAYAAAVDNLRDMTVSNFMEFVPGLFVGDWGDSYETSRILFPDVVFQADVGADPVMMIPTRNRLLVASGRDKATMLAMVELSRKLVNDEGRPVSALMYKFDNGRAVEFRPGDADVCARLDDLRRIFLADDYAAQKNLLDRANEQNGIDVFVASYQLYQSKEESGGMSSLGVWTEDVDTLLPETDLVALVSSADLEAGGGHKLIKWRDLQAVTGAFERVDDGYPVLFRPANFPDKARREAMEEAVL